MVYIKQRRNAQFFSIPPNLIIEESYLQTFLHTLITDIMTDSSSIEEFRNKLFEKYGVAVHETRGRISYQLPDRKSPFAADLLAQILKKFYRDLHN